jgi:type IV pilus assembly protein PilB
MQIPDEAVQKILTSSKKLDAEGADKLAKDAAHQKKSLQDLALTRQIISEPELTKLYAAQLDVPFVTLDPQKIDVDLLKSIPERIARRYNVVLYGQTDKVKQLAMEDPDDVQAIDYLQKELNDKLEISVASKENILNVLDLYRGNISNELTKVIAEDEEDAAVDEDVSEEDVAEDSPIAQTVNLVIDYAVKANASDIHIEPREGYVQIRYRIDGVLREANRLPKKVQSALVSRIKILSNLKIDEHRVPQDGRFKVSVNDRVFALRVSVLPIADGEKVVIRLLNESNKAQNLTELGFWGYSLEAMKNAMVQPHGIILVTGPTGSGKSTTLFSVLSLLNDQTVNISTVEDPIEYKIFGANQTQVNPKAGMTFAGGLRSLLRQDPNIIMVGEIRDHETADLAIQAALTGHLVFSTLHTNNAATCLPRLLDMGIEPFLIASTARAVVGQRLVRKLCESCKKIYTPEKEEITGLSEVFHLDREDAWKHLAELEKKASEQEIGDAKETAVGNGTIAKLFKAGDDGCEACNHTGFKGRIGIYEVLDSTSEIQKMIINNSTSENIQNEAVKEGMVTMQMDGLIKALRGWTTTEEILRVTRE